VCCGVRLTASKLFEANRSKLRLNSLLNGQKADDFESALAYISTRIAIPVFFDKESFHAARGPSKAVNYLYADGHIKNLLANGGDAAKMISLTQVTKKFRRARAVSEPHAHVRRGDASTSHTRLRPMPAVNVRRRSRL